MSSEISPVPHLPVISLVGMDTMGTGKKNTVNESYLIYPAWWHWCLGDALNRSTVGLILSVVFTNHLD